MENKLDIRKKNDLILAMNKSDIVVHKKYLSQLINYDIVPLSNQIENEDLNKISRFYRLEQFVFDKSENTRDKLVSVFQAVAGVGGSIVVLIDSSGSNIDYYVGVRSIEKNPAEAHEVLYKSLCANFPGITFKNYNSNSPDANYSSCTLSKSSVEALSRSVFENNSLNRSQPRSITTVTGIAGLRLEKENSEQRFIQGIEKVVDAMRGERYSLLLIAEPVANSKVQAIRRGYENLYSAIKPFENTVLTYGENENESVTATYSQTITDTINQSVTDTITKTEGKTYSTSKTESDTKGISVNPGGAASLVGAGIGSIFGGPVGAAIGAGIGGAIGSIVNYNKSHTSSTSFTESVNYSNSESYGTTRGTSNSLSETKSDASTKGSGTNRTLQISFENKAVKNMMDTIDAQLKRIDTAGSLGMWSCAAYCIADNSVVSEMAAAAYYSVIRGEDSYLEAGAITQWTGNKLDKVNSYLKKMLHPIVNVDGEEMPTASFISTKELAIHAGFPEKSVAGLPVTTMSSFGREVVSKKSVDGTDFNIGKIYHMGKKEEVSVILDKDSFTGHTFITGSTGSGKSNTIYQILKEAEKYDSKFLVIEPAKGEYKHIFGNRNDVSVYGTNPYKSELLRINPFSFPEDIHVLEHLDRLVEIFNVCWPMYAAMPAVLKKAVELAYIDAGWDLVLSKNSFDRKLLPCFSDVMNNVLKVIDESEYSEENKGNYKGALVTRLESLTNGINGIIFTNEDIPDKDLFDKNVIVDLSRVGSAETKSLIMGILAMKLQEYRMTSGKLNAALSHITVLEEAHNLLKRTSTEQSTEMANLIGKSVEMLANSIAEMRTYGEGFIIADQSPGLLDMSVIRNTNTKIIMRTPDFSDRELVGKAAGLNDDQIIEIGKLPLGVAAVYQNDWIEPVLCKVNHFPVPDNRYEYIAQKYFNNDSLKFRIRLVKYLLSNAVKEKIDEDIDDLKEKILASNILAYDKKNILKLLSLNTLPDTLENLQGLIASLHVDSVKIAISAIEKSDNPRELNHLIAEKIQPNLFEYDEYYQAIILQCIINECANSKKELSEIPGRWIEFMHHGR